MPYSVDHKIRGALAALAQAPEVMRALADIEDDQGRCIEEHKQLTAIEAPTFQEQARARLYLQKLRGLGLEDVHIDAGGNVLGLRRGKGDGPCVLLEAHLDTVFPTGSVSGVREEDGFLYAPGVSDNTRGLAMLLSLARALDAAGIETAGSLLFAGTTREEGRGGMQGMKQLLQDHKGRIAASVSIDSGSLRNIIYEATGLRTVKVRFHGTGGHAFGAFGQVAHPLHAAARAIAKISDFEVSENPRTTFCVSSCHAGNEAGVHAIPQTAEITINYRSNDPEELEKLHRRIFGAIEEACREESARWGQDTIRWESEPYCDIPAGTQNPHAPIVEGLYAAIEQIGLSPRFLRGGATNCSIAIGEGIPAVCISSYYPAGDGDILTMDHTLAEKYPVAGAYKGVQLLLLLALLYAGTGGSPSIL